MHFILFLQYHLTSGDSEIASLVIKESEDEGEEARKFLEEVRVSFPQVCIPHQTGDRLFHSSLFFSFISPSKSRVFLI